MNENIKAFMQKVAADEEMQAKMKSFTDMDAAYEFAKSVQEGFSKEEFTEVMTKINAAASENGELSDEDLSAVAGGLSTTGAEVAFYTGAASASAALAASAI